MLHGKWLHGPASRRRQRHLKERTGSKSSILFFGDIAGIKPEDYLNDFRAAVGPLGDGASDDGTDLELDYAGQIVTNSEITLLKLWIFEVAFVIASVGFLVACVAAFAHLLHSKP